MSAWIFAGVVFSVRCAATRFMSCLALARRVLTVVPPHLCIWMKEMLRGNDNVICSKDDDGDDHDNAVMAGRF